MGPVRCAKDGPVAKSSPACTRLYAGLVFLIFAGVMLVPVLHHLLPHFPLGDSR
jgi:hypothetical protein